jgi:hypothetical protein
MLQAAYLKPIETKKNKICEVCQLSFIFPNGKSDEISWKFTLALLAMSGRLDPHGLFANNRSYYYNSIIQKFEPIYYDGNLDLNQTLEINPRYRDRILKSAFGMATSTDSFIDSISSLLTNKALVEKFYKRVLIPNDLAGNIFNQMLLSFVQNVKILSKALDENKVFPPTDSAHHQLLNSYQKTQKEYFLEQKIITEISNNANGFRATLHNSDIVDLSNNDVAQILGRNNYLNSRYVIIAEPDNQSWHLKKVDANEDGLRGQITHSTGIRLDMDVANKKLNIYQNSPLDWLLIKNAKINNWSISFFGVLGSNAQLDQDRQRFNSFGLTGCLNFFNTTFVATNLTVNNADCEDAVNIMNSNGTLSKINVEGTAEDAVDIDFSKLEIFDINVLNARNDCLDLSGGNYRLRSFTGTLCGDKGISVGEQSKLSAQSVWIDTASTGISSKDLSEVEVKQADFSNVETCFEALHKKQEFGGGKLEIGNINCLGEISVDNTSIARVDLR